tara:strand:+ start:14935 stop:15177 length:243 start_codon:yes stop_codon:yes gene_type:complete
MPKLKKQIELHELNKENLFAHVRKSNYERLKIHFEAIYRKGFEDGVASQKLKTDEQIIQSYLNEEFFKNKNVREDDEQRG